ncbi:MAG: hypothetical protein EOP53_03970 [Sphingobacteriales bacterium]|nr:MAG: hypothetical protein EOP53_03970 [Sphingobacteriales bacterium]
MIIGNSTLPIDSLYMQDSLVNGRLASTAAFSINLAEGEIQPPVLNILQASLFKNAPVDISIWYGSHQNSIQRNYTAAVIVEFVLPELNASDGRATATVMVRLKSNSVKSNENAGPLVFTPKERPRPLLKSNFTASFGDLPAARFSNIRFSKNAAGNWVTVETSIADIEAWSNWLTNGSKKMDASVYLLAPDMRTRVKQVKLLGAEAVSIKRSFIKTEERIQRFTLLFKVANILLEDAK